MVEERALFPMDVAQARQTMQDYVTHHANLVIIVIYWFVARVAVQVALTTMDGHVSNGIGSIRKLFGKIRMALVLAPYQISVHLANQ
jgi:hypothetical protein